MKLSIVATMYNSSKYVIEFVDRITACAEMITPEYEVILVDDGSPDSSLQIAKAYATEKDFLKIIELSKNHGHHRAMMIGLEYSAGDFVYLTDIDLEEAPENLTQFWAELKLRPEYDVVYGRQPEKKRPWLQKLLSEMFYFVFNALSNVTISNRDLVSRLMNRSFVDSLLRYQEEAVFIPALWEDTGFNQTYVLMEKHFDGFSTYSLSKRITLAVDAVTSFSSKPLVFVFYAGIGISFLALLSIFYLILSKLYFGEPLLGWTSIIAAVFLMGGLILFALGVIGIYVSKIFVEVKARPRSIIRAVHQYK